MDEKQALIEALLQISAAMSPIVDTMAKDRVLSAIDHYKHAPESTLSYKGVFKGRPPHRVGDYDVEKLCRLVVESCDVEAPATGGTLYLQPCGASDCLSQHGGRCLNSTSVCSKRVLPGAPDPCLEPCDNEECGTRDAEAGKCLFFKLCASYCKPMAECYAQDCDSHTLGDKCAASEVCAHIQTTQTPPANPCCTNANPCDEHKPTPEVIQSYTLAQWQAIVDGGYLCEFAPDDGFYPSQKRIAALAAFDILTFDSEGAGSWSCCRPAQIPGVLRPWFGGKRPIDSAAMVLVKFRNEESSVDLAMNLEWGHYGDNGTDIIAYMEV